MAFNLGVRNSPHAGKAQKPNSEPTLAEWLELVERSHLTTDEAKLISCRLLWRTREWQAPPSREDRTMYRPPTEAEVSEVEALS